MFGLTPDINSLVLLDSGRGQAHCFPFNMFLLFTCSQHLDPVDQRNCLKVMTMMEPSQNCELGSSQCGLELDVHW